MIDYMQLVTQAAEKYGFNLEFKTKEIFEKNQYQVDLNVPLRDGIEVDVHASRDQNRQVLIECKGTDPSSCLILIKDPKKNYKTNRYNIPNSKFAIAQYKPHAGSDFYTFTGDFFNLKNKELKRSSINDENNNFYKAQIQIMEALNAFYMSEASRTVLSMFEEDNNNGESEERCFLIPMIVTNADKIWVVDYSKKDGIAKPHKWVLQRARINDYIHIEYKNGEKPYSISVAVVSINYLDQFLKFVENMFLSHGEISIENSYLEDNK